MHLSSRRKSTNRTSYNTLTVLTLLSSLQWRTTSRRMPSSSWTPLLNQRLVGICLLLCTGNPPTPTQYLQWDNHLYLSATFSVINTLIHRVQTVCSNPEHLHKEMDHLSKAFTQSKCPKWGLDKVEKSLNRPFREVTDGANNQNTAGAQSTTNEVKTKGHIVTPYTDGLCESIQEICGRYGIQTQFKGDSTIKNPLVLPRTNTPWSAKVRPYIGSNVVTLPVMMNT